MEGTGEILALGRVDAGFAADGTINLREQSRWHLNKAASALHNMRGKAGDIAHYTAAQRNMMVFRTTPGVEVDIRAAERAITAGPAA